jgi:membrane fusion protein, protease secretion system
VTQDNQTTIQALSRQGYLIIAFGFGGFLLWGSLVPLAEGVPTGGQVSIETKRKAIQHLQGGLVEEVLVREGQTVKANDVLMRLDDSSVKAQFETARQSLAALRENLAAEQALLRGLAEAEKNRLEQLSLIQRELQGLRELVKEGYAPAVQQFQLERSMADTQTAIADLKTNRQRTQQSILEVQHQIIAASGRLSAAQEDLTRLELRAPTSGQVVGLMFQNKGAVIQPGQKIMDIVPESEPLLIEARVAPHHIDRLVVGQPVDVRFSSFAQTLPLVADARLESISKDVLTDSATQQSYYLARVVLTESGEQSLKGRELQPGMPVEVILKTGERSLLAYLLQPLTRRFAASLKEE